MTPPAPPARTLATSAGLVAFHDEGEGPPVLLIHGFPISSWQWREFIPLLAARFRVIAPDLPGSGASTAADGVKLDLAAHAAAIRELLAEISVERFAVVAHGAGAGVAQLLALDGAQIVVAREIAGEAAGAGGRKLRRELRNIERPT